MKKLFIIATFLITTCTLSAQMLISSIQNNDSELLINDSISIKKSSEIQINLPIVGSKDFVFVTPKKSLINGKLLKSVASIAGTGALATMGLGGSGVSNTAFEVLSKSDAIYDGVSTIEQIQNLPISKSAKKIVGKKMKVLEWKIDDNSYVVIATLDKKKYEIELQAAAGAGEIKF